MEDKEKEWEPDVGSFESWIKSWQEYDKIKKEKEEKEQQGKE